MNIKFTIPIISSFLILNWILFPSSVMSQPEKGGNWLEEKNNWNQVNASIPKPPNMEGGNNLEYCNHTVRQGVLPEDRLIEKAGWVLTDAAHIYGKTTIITGMVDADGMCRPLNYQVFVFSEGKFIGTLSPIPMDSRTDGSLINFNLYRDGYIDASFNRYSPEDALCCATGKSRLFYQVEKQNNYPLLVPKLPADTFSNED